MATVMVPVVNSKNINKYLMDIQKYILKDEKELINGVKNGCKSVDMVKETYKRIAKAQDFLNDLATELLGDDWVGINHSEEGVLAYVIKDLTDKEYQINILKDHYRDLNSVTVFLRMVDLRINGPLQYEQTLDISCLDDIPALYTDYAYELILAAALRELEANFKNE